MLMIRDLVKVYPGSVTALGGVSLEIDRGMFGLLGPNGAGKTTLMRILAGLLEPTSGQVSLGGLDVVADPPGLWRQLGYLPQDFGFYPNLSGAAMLRYLLEIKGVEAPGGLRQLTDALLARVNLTFAAKRKVKTYSGGMRQRLGIAQAIAGDPQLLIVDEPTVGLDPEERLRLYRLLAELADERIVLLSTHIVDDVAMLCPRFAVLRAGRLAAVRTPQEALGAIDGTIFEGQVSAADLDTFATRHRVTQAILVAGSNRVRVHVASGPPPAGFVPVAPSLEDAYLLMTTHDDGATEAAA